MSVLFASYLADGTEWCLGQCKKGWSHPGKERPQEGRAWAKEQSEQVATGAERVKNLESEGSGRVVLRFMVPSGAGRQTGVWNMPEERKTRDGTR